MLAVFTHIRQSLAKSRFSLQELSGSLGDLGTFLPLILGLAYVSGLSFPAMLFWAGASNVITGLTFSIPMPVQPMKAIAAVAFSEGMNANEIYAAGIIMAVFMLLIGLFNLNKYLDKYIPLPIIRGIQFTIGLKLLLKGGSMIYSQPLLGPDSILIGAIGLLFVIIFFNTAKVPTALVLFVAGIFIIYWGGNIGNN